MTDPNAGMQVLVADDEPSIRFVMTEVLEGLGHQVVAVEDGDSALGELTRGSFDLAFLDIRMPGRTGIEVLQQCRASGCDVAIVIITAQNLLENAVESMKAGALDYLVKPFALAEVEALAEKALSTRALQKEVRTLRRAVGRSVAPGGERLVGSSHALLEIYKTVGKVELKMWRFSPADHKPSDKRPAAVFFFGVIGFPFALFFAWVFEVTSDGVKRESEIKP